MPRYNGALSYPVEVLLHLLWCYAIFAVGYLAIAAPFVLISAASGQLLESLVAWARSFAGAPLFFLLGVHVFTLVCFRFVFLPRFPYSHALLTFAVAAAFGSLINAVAWPLEHCRQQLAGAAGAQCLSAVTDVAGLWAGFKWFALLSVGAGLLGLMLQRMGFFVPAWIARLFVGSSRAEIVAVRHHGSEAGRAS